MNDAVKAQLVDWLKQFAEAIKQGAEFVQVQTPLVVQEKITYMRVTETIWTIWGLLLTIAGVWFAKRAWHYGVQADTAKNAARQWHWTDEDCMKVLCFGIVPSALSLICGTATFFFHVDTALLVWFAPRLYILQWVMDGLK